MREGLKNSEMSDFYVAYKVSNYPDLASQMLARDSTYLGQRQRPSSLRLQQEP